VGLGIKARRAGWTARAAARDARGRLSDAGNGAARRAEPVRCLIDTRVAWPLQRRVDTRVAWPLADAFRGLGVAARTVLATGALAALAGAAAFGVLAGGGGGPGGGSGAPTLAAGPAPAELASAAGPALKGIVPEFESAEGEAGKARAPGAAGDAAIPPPVAPPPGAPPAEVARSFAGAFVEYEIGEVSERTAAVFAAVAEKPLAEALATEPPRLPASAEVPKAEVLNVVMGEREGEKVEASVSLSRLDAASELRLTLEHTPEGWQVTRVLG
jgi:hypothetical protein